jgi:hypothetical protein
MNIFRKMYYKWLIKRHFKKEFVDTGVVRPNFSVIFDKEKQDFLISYTPIETKDITEYGGEVDIIEDETPKIEEENE